MMKKSKVLTNLAVAALGLMLVACGPSNEKLQEAEEARSLLLQAREVAEQTFMDITDSSNKEKLKELSGKASEIEALDFSKMDDKKIDEVLPSITEMTDEYQSLGVDMTAILDKETAVREEKAKHEQRDVFFINKTGMNLSKVVLHDLTKDLYSDNYIGEGVTLADGYTLMGVTLDIYKDSNEWEFVVTDEGGTDYVLSCGSIRELDQNGVTIVLEYNTNTKSGSAEVPTEEEEEELEDPIEFITEESAAETSGEE